jgi:uncharacterized protein
VCFDSEPLDEEMVVLGVPIVRLAVTSDRPLALVAVRLCEVAKDGASTLVSWGLLNLTHRDGHEAPVSLVPGSRYDVSLGLNVIGHRFAPGSRLRLAVSQAYWPHAWPSPEPVTLSLQLDGCSLDLPVTGGPLRRLAEAFEEPEYSSDEILLRPGGRTRVRESDESTSTTSITDLQEFSSKLESGTTYAGVARDRWEITGDDPLSARAEAHRDESLVRGEWCVRAVVNSTLTASATHFLVDDTLTAYEGEEVVFVDSRHFSIPRDGV